MPPRGLFSEISEGIFGRLNELTAEQTKRDEDKRGQVLNLLTGLMDKVEPESQGTLLGHIGDVMKLKGKERGLWDRLTMKDMDATEQALGGKLQGVLGGIVGPGTARQKRGAAVADVATSTFSSPRTLDQASGLEGSMVMRDPRQERLEQLKTQYGMQFAQRQALQDEREADIYKRQMDLTNQRDILKRRGQIFDSELRAQRDVDALASTIAAKSGRTTITQADRMTAADNLLKSAALDDDAKQALIKLRGQQGSLAETEAASLQSGIGMSAPVARKESADRALQTELQGVYGPYAQAFEEIKIKRPKLESIYGQLEALAKENGVQFNRNTGDFTGDLAGVILARANAGDTVNIAKRLATEITDAESRQARGYSTLTSGYGTYIEQDPNTGYIRLKAPYGAPRTQSGVPSVPAAKPSPPVPPVKAPSKYPRGQAPPPLQMPLGAKNPGVQLPKIDLSGTNIPYTKEPIPMPGLGSGYVRGRFSSRRLQKGESIRLNDDKWYAVEAIVGPEDADPIYVFRLLPQQ